MLSRTADNLFWMCRYTERAENTARMLDVNLQMSLLPQDAQAREGSWLAVLRISEVHGAGGYGMLVGAVGHARRSRGLQDRVRANPALHRQPTLALSTVPYVESGVAPRHVDLRPRAVRQGHPHGARRTVPRGADRRLAGGQQQPGRRHQGDGWRTEPC